MAWTNMNGYMSIIFLAVVVVSSLGYLGSSFVADDRVELSEDSLDYILTIQGQSVESGIDGIATTESSESQSTNVLTSEDDAEVSDANSYTGDLWVFGALSVFFIISYIALTDKTGFTNFGFDDVRGLFVSFAVCVVMAVQLIEIGWSVNFYSVGFFSSAYLVNGILIIIYESKSGADI